MIVPVFGVGAGDEAMAALKKEIEAQGEFMVKIVDLPAILSKNCTTTWAFWGASAQS